MSGFIGRKICWSEGKRIMQKQFVNYSQITETLDLCAEYYGFYMWGESKYTIQDKLNHALNDVDDFCIDRIKMGLIYCNNSVNFIDFRYLVSHLDDCNKQYFVNSTISITLNRTNSTRSIIDNFKTIKMYVDCYCDPFRSFDFY